ncbi:MAG: hypothetical protein QOE70_2486 [Chthoniobacter sp.]|nr:hypothetical protein [Chthoniobacter sp.]
MPALKLTVRNLGKSSPFVARQQEVADVEFDGQWYQWSGPIDVLSGPLTPGDHPPMNTTIRTTIVCIAVRPSPSLPQRSPRGVLPHSVSSS